MDPAYEPIFRQRYEQILRRRRGTYYQLADDLLTRAAEQSGIRLRSDAQVFLLINLAEMVLVPASGADDIPDAPQPEQVRDGIFEDLLSLFRTMRKTARGDAPFSANATFRALASQDGSMFVQSAQFWGPGREEGQPAGGY